jgi:hypothetical protein
VRWRYPVAFAGALTLTAIPLACGARTGLLVADVEDVSVEDARELDASEEDATAEDAITQDVAEEDVVQQDVVEEDVVTIDATGNCPTEATLIYITGQGGALYSFWPPSFQFTFIGNLTCTNSPTHMTVDRHGVAWLVSNGMLYRASTRDASCTAVANWTPQPAGFSDFGLSFVGTSMNDTSLYVLGTPNLGLFDTVTGNFSIVGDPGISTNGDMTSNGDGTLYFMLDDPQLVLYDLSPSTAQVIDSRQVPVAQGGGSAAVAYFGGRFYAFENNNVYAFDWATDTTTSLGPAPIEVTGAGQSTCVPTMPTDAGAPDVGTSD